VLDAWCHEVGRDPAAIERVGAANSREFDRLDDMVKAGATHLILGWGAPWDLAPIKRLLAWRDAQ
jgi:hypothetical protein